MMKKIFSIMVIALLPLFAMAETTDYPTKKNVEVNGFFSNWFFTVGAGAQVSDHSMPAPEIEWNSVTPSASLSLGKWITPVFGLRTQFNAGHYSTLSKCDYDANAQLGGSWFIDAMFNLSNTFLYKEDRFWNLVPFVGYGRVYSQEDWKCGHWGWNAGFDNQFRLSKHTRLDVEFYARRFNGYTVAGQFDNAQPQNWNVGAQLGVAVELGNNKWKHAADVVAINTIHNAQIDALNDALRRAYECCDSSANRKPEVVQVERVVVVEKPSNYSIFFSGDSYRIESKKDLVNLKNFADYVNANSNATVTVTGYADSKTGSVEYNQKLSEQRAETIKNALVELGVSEDKIIVKALGGVYDLNPYNYNRRVVVTASNL